MGQVRVTLVLCDDYWCCNGDKCVEVGTIVNYAGKSYLCVHASLTKSLFFFSHQVIFHT